MMVGGRAEGGVLGCEGGGRGMMVEGGPGGLGCGCGCGGRARDARVESRGG